MSSRDANNSTERRGAEAAEKSAPPSDVGLVAAAMHCRLVNADDFVIGLDDTRAQIAAGIRRRRLPHDRRLGAALRAAGTSWTAHGGIVQRPAGDKQVGDVRTRVPRLLASPLLSRADMALKKRRLRAKQRVLSGYGDQGDRRRRRAA
jgi:hypothetical protein